MNQAMRHSMRYMVISVVNISISGRSGKKFRKEHALQVWVIVLRMVAGHHIYTSSSSRIWASGMVITLECVLRVIWVTTGRIVLIQVD